MKTLYPFVKAGNIYGSLTILFQLGKNKWGHKEWRCKCACGKYRSAFDYDLKRGACTQCAECSHKARAEKLRGRASPKRIDMTGRIYGRLTVIEFARTENHHAIWRCQCLCGNFAEFSAIGLRQDNHYSCGCYRRGQDVNREPRKHKARTPKQPTPVKKLREPTVNDDPDPDAGAVSMIPKDGRLDLILAARKTLTPWREVAELVGMTIEECKAAAAA